MLGHGDIGETEPLDEVCQTSAQEGEAGATSFAVVEWWPRRMEVRKETRLKTRSGKPRAGQLRRQTGPKPSIFD